MWNIAHSWILNAETVITWPPYHPFCCVCFKWNNICAINSTTPSAGKVLITKSDVFPSDSIVFTLNPAVLVSSKLRHEISSAKPRCVNCAVEFLPNFELMRLLTLVNNYKLWYSPPRTYLRSEALSNMNDYCELASCVAVRYTRHSCIMTNHGTCGFYSHNHLLDKKFVDLRILMYCPHHDKSWNASNLQS